MQREELSLFEVEKMDSSLSIVEQIESRVLEPSPAEVDRTIDTIQHHLEKEARNRQVSMVEPQDLCPSQKRDLVRELKRMLS